MKKISFDKELNEKLSAGVNKLASAVCSTLGPKGRTVILKSKNRRPIVTKDGVTVSKFIEFDDLFEDVAAQIIRQSAESTVSLAGDGTTTSTALAQAIFTEAQPLLQQGIAPDTIRVGIEKALKNILEDLKKLSTPVANIKQIEQIATISANGYKGVGKLLATAVDKVGKDGSITIQEGRKNETELEISEGFRFDSGFNARDFVTDERRGIMRYEDGFILVTDRKITLIDDLMPILSAVAKDGRPLIIVAEDVEGQALAALLLNKMRGTMRVAAIKAPRYGEERRNILADLCLITGATFISRESGLRIKDVVLSQLGSFDLIESTKFSSTLISEAADGEAIDASIEGLKEQLTQTSDLRIGEQIQERITRLSSGIAIIKVGGFTEVEMIEKKHRIEDALEAVNSASQEGVVPGGGMALLACKNSFMRNISGDEVHGAGVLAAALSAPRDIMFQNAGLNPRTYYEEKLPLSVDGSLQYGGYDLSQTPPQFVDLVKVGIIDPTKVTRCALENAVSAAVALFTTNVAIVEIE